MDRRISDWQISGFRGGSKFDQKCRTPGPSGNRVGQEAIIEPLAGLGVPRNRKTVRWLCGTIVRLFTQYDSLHGLARLQVSGLIPSHMSLVNLPAVEYTSQKAQDAVVVSVWDRLVSPSDKL